MRKIGKKISLFFIILVGIHFLMGCATIKKWFGDETEVVKNTKETPPVAPPIDDAIRFSENPNIGVFNDRKYKRATRKTIEEDSDVGSRAGSLWNTEGPSSYLFTQNKLHREGDLLSVKLEGSAKIQMDTKIQVIKKLLARLEIVNNTNEAQPEGTTLGSASSAENRTPASVAASSPKDKVESNPTKSLTSSTTSAPAPKLNADSNSSDIEIPIQVETIPTRVTERMTDGNYRVKGQQSFMIGKKEFKVIITGLVRPEDFADEGMSSNKLLDSQLDVVSLRRSLK